MATTSVYEYKKVKKPDKVSLEELNRIVREFNALLEDLSIKTYNNIQYANLSTGTKNLIDSKAGTDTLNTHITQNNEQISLLATKQEVVDSLDDVSGQLATLADTVDGKSTTYIDDTEPIEAVIRDIWFQGSAEKVWKKIAEGTGPTVWEDITTSALSAALHAAADAQATADRKIVTYRQPSKPTGGTYGVGDLWFDSDDKEKMYRWDGTDWVSAQDTHLDATVTQHTTQIQQNADAILLKADQTTVDAQGETLEQLSSTVSAIPGEVDVNIANKTVWVGETPPTGAALYVGKLWQDTLTDEQLRWKGIVENTARSYLVTKNGAAIPVNDLSDEVSFNASVVTVSKQSPGTPSPASPLPISGYDAVVVRRSGRNRAFNSAFATDSSGWAFDTGVSRDTGVNEDGNNSIKFLVSGLSADEYRRAQLDSNHRVRVNTGDVVTVSAYTYLEDYTTFEGRSLALEIVEYDAAGVRITGNFVGDVFTPTVANNNGGRRLVSTHTVTNANVSYVSAHIWVQRNGAFWAFKPQIEVSASVTAYEAYIGTDYTLTPLTTLWGHPSVADSITNGGTATHNTVYRKLTGDENWTKNAGWSGNTFNLAGVITDSASVSGYTTSANIISSHFPVNTPANIASGAVGVGIGNGTELFIGFGSDTSQVAFQDVASLKYWLSTHDVQIVYQKASALVESISPKQINGVSGFNSISSDGVFYPLTYVGSGWALASGAARKLYAGANYKMDENGLEITQTSIDGSPVSVKYIANAEKSGHFRASDNTQLGGIRIASDGTPISVAGALMDPESDGSAYVDVVTETASGSSVTELKFMGVSYEGATDPNPSDPSMDPDKVGVVEGLAVGFDTLVQWDGTSYSDTIFAKIKTTGALGVYADQMYLSVLDGTGQSKCGISFDANRDNAIRSWGVWYSANTIQPIETNSRNLGSADLRWKYIYSNNSLQTPSDERIKKDIAPIANALQFLMALNPFEYRYNFDASDAPKRMGFGAGETEAALNAAGMSGYAVVNRENPDELGMGLTELIAPIVHVVQQQQKTIESQQSKLEELEAKLNDVIAKLA